jgi:hypothetical protein
MTKITGLDNARAMREMGLPLNTEVVERGRLPKRQEKMIRRVLSAADVCRAPVHRYIKRQSVHNFAALRRAHRRLGAEIERIPVPNWVEELDGGKRLTNPEDAWSRPSSGRGASVGPRNSGCASSRSIFFAWCQGPQNFVACRTKTRAMRTKPSAL